MSFAYTQGEIRIFSEPLLRSAFARLVQGQLKTFNQLSFYSFFDFRAFSKHPSSFFSDLSRFRLQRVCFFTLLVFAYKAISRPNHLWFPLTSLLPQIWYFLEAFNYLNFHPLLSFRESRWAKTSKSWAFRLKASA